MSEDGQGKRYTNYCGFEFTQAEANLVEARAKDLANKGMEAIFETIIQKDMVLIDAFKRLKAGNISEMKELRFTVNFLTSVASRALQIALEGRSDETFNFLSGLGRTPDISNLGLKEL